MDKPKSKARDFFFGTSPDLPKIVELDLTQITPNPDQPRKTIDEKKLQELAASIERQGLIQPIVVKKLENQDGYILVAGERRFRAHQLLNKTSIPAIVTKGNSDEIALIENIQREDLNPLEEAEALQRMIDRYHYTQDELGKVIGKAQNTLSETLQINTLPQKIKEEYRAPDTQKISKTVLVEITRLKTTEEQLRLWDIVKTGRLTSRQVRAKKHQTTIRTDAEHTKLTLSVGRKFIRTLEKVAITSLVPNHDSHRELIEIQRRINELIETLSERER